MIDAILETVREFGLLAGGGLGIVSVGLWLRRLQVVATWFRIGSILAVALGLGAAVGVVDLGRMWELALALWRALPIGQVGALELVLAP